MPFTVFAGLPPLKPYGNVAGIPSCMRDGGRLIGCDADTLPEAIAKSYEAVKTVKFDNAFYRNDIGKKALAAEV